MLFVFAGIFTELAKSIRRKIRPRFMKADGVTPAQPGKFVYDVMGTIATAFILNYAGAAFIFLALEPSLVLYPQLYWIGHVLVAIGYVVVTVLPTPKNQPTQRGAAPRAAPATSSPATAKANEATAAPGDVISPKNK
eukprot:TRINITY_DN4390_c0_g1_i1.p1 TRINITY_DN4390_c0_g1~~TRINITY_DN4390_c0_g1_i1.p1  ORF type:complete len:137 (-),score=22.24 TRINITY_DN4390_c0_g1_i1:24-434(-)